MTTRYLGVLCGVFIICVFGVASPTRADEKSPAAPAAVEQSGVDLRPRFVVGRETRYTMKSTSTSENTPLSTSKNAPAPTQSKIEQEIGLLLRPTKVNDDGSAEVQLVYESLKLKAAGGDIELDFDSTKPAKQSAAPEDLDLGDMFLRGIVGTTLTLNVNADGSISGVTGGGSLGAIGDLAGLATPDTNWITGSTSQANAGTRTVGERWTNHDKLAGTPLGQFDMLTTHTLKRMKGPTAEVEFTSVLESAASQAAGTNAQVERAGAKGKYQWDTGKGELAEMNSEQTSVIKAGTGDQAQRMTSTQTVRVTRRGR